MNTNNQLLHQHKFEYVYIFKNSYYPWDKQKPRQCICKICDCGYKIYYRQAKNKNYRVSLLPTVEKANEPMQKIECDHIVGLRNIFHINGGVQRGFIEVRQSDINGLIMLEYPFKQCPECGEKFNQKKDD